MLKLLNSSFIVSTVLVIREHTFSPSNFIRLLKKIVVFLEGSMSQVVDLNPSFYLRIVTLL